MAGDGKQLDAGREPECECTKQRNLEIGAEGMVRPASACDLPELEILASGERQEVVILLEQMRHPGSLLRRIEGVRGNVVYRNRFHVELPGHQIHIAKSPEPRIGPGIKSERSIFSR